MPRRSAEGAKAGSLRSHGLRASFGSTRHELYFARNSTRAGGPSQKNSGTAALSAISDKGTRTAGLSAEVFKGTGTADLSAEVFKGTGTADLSAEAPKARRPM
jgi:hypothetical protein